MIQKRFIEGLDFYRAVEFFKDEKNHLRFKLIENEDEYMMIRFTGPESDVESAMEYVENIFIKVGLLL